MFRVLTTLAVIATAASASGVYSTSTSASAASFDIQRKVIASDDGAFDFFGTSVAVDGNSAIVSAIHNDDAGSNSGSAYLVNASTGQELFKLTASDAAADDNFGSVAISGNRAIVGAGSNDSNGFNAGAAYVFDVSTGQQLYKLTASDAAANDYFGGGVSISGNLAVVSAATKSVDGKVLAGAAYVFDIITGQQLYKLTASDAAINDRFGAAVAVSGTTIVIGADFDDDAGNASGSAYVFDATTGAQLRKLHALDAAPEDLFGRGIALSGTTAIIGAQFDDDRGSMSGSAYLFDVVSGTQLHKLTAFDGAANEFFGDSVAISGNTAIVGSAFKGVAYLFDVATGNLIRTLSPFDGSPGGSFGYSVGISGDRAIIGASTDSRPNRNQAGAAYIFSREVPEPQSITLALSLFLFLRPSVRIQR